MGILITILGVCIFCGVCIGLYNLKVTNSVIETKNLLKKQVALQEEQLRMQKENK